MIGDRLEPHAACESQGKLEVAALTRRHTGVPTCIPQTAPSYTSAASGLQTARRAPRTRTPGAWCHQRHGGRHGRRQVVDSESRPRLEGTSCGLRRGLRPVPTAQHQMIGMSGLRPTARLRRRTQRVALRRSSHRDLLGGSRHWLAATADARRNPLDFLPVMSCSPSRRLSRSIRFSV